MTELSEAQVQARAKAQRLANAFQSVFGQPHKRTAEQTLVIDRLTVQAGDDGNSYRFNEGKDGIALVAAGIHRDGAKSLLRTIEWQLAQAKNIPAPKPKPATKR